MEPQRCSKVTSNSKGTAINQLIKPIHLSINLSRSNVAVYQKVFLPVLKAFSWVVGVFVLILGFPCHLAVRIFGHVNLLVIVAFFLHRIVGETPSGTCKEIKHRISETETEPPRVYVSQYQGLTLLLTFGFSFLDFPFTFFFFRHFGFQMFLP